MRSSVPAGKVPPAAVGLGFLVREDIVDSVLHVLGSQGSLPELTSFSWRKSFALKAERVWRSLMLFPYSSLQ